jgi:hypothetical protein
VTSSHVSASEKAIPSKFGMCEPVGDRPKLYREWQGLVCRVRYDVRLRGGANILKGTEVVVSSPCAGGVNVHTPRCDHCGVQWHCIRLEVGALDIVGRVAPPAPARSR